MCEEESPMPGCIRLTYVVADTGIGMSPEFMETMYQPFSRQTDSRVNSIEGTGLGLAITKQMVDLMGGTIGCQSEQGKGTTFTVALDIPTADRQLDDFRLDDIDALIVDDDEIALQTMSSELESLGAEAELAHSGKEALEIMSRKHESGKAHSIVIIDWKMPDMDGLEVTRQIRQIIGNDSAIIFLTAYNWDEILEEATKAGVDKFMAKPLFASHIMESFIQVMKQKNVSFKKMKKLADLTGKKILLAEDMLVNAEIMKELLKMRDMEVEHAENGQLVVEMFAKSPLNYYDAVLMDVRMPIMDGLQATKEIRKLDRPDAKTVPIIAMTANAFDEDVQRSLQAGMNAHLSKPVEPEHMYQTLQELIKD